MKGYSQSDRENERGAEMDEIHVKDNAEKLEQFSCFAENESEC